jgi:hypothetical protein
MMVVLVSGLCATVVGWILALGLMRMNGPADKATPDTETVDD